MTFVWEDIKIKKIMKIKILTPIYNDWQSVSKLIDEIDNLLITSNFEISIIIINDASSHDRLIEKKPLKNIESIKILNMKKNQGHTRCIATGLKYIFENCFNCLLVSNLIIFSNSLFLSISNFFNSILSIFKIKKLLPICIT